MKRMIVYALTERETLDTALLEKGLSDVKEKGFDSIHFEWRNVSCSFSHPRMQKTIREFNKIARGMGLKVDTHANPIAVNSLKLSNDMPEIFSDPIEAIPVKLTDGKFTLTIGREKLHWDIEKCYLVEKKEESSLSEFQDLTDKTKEISCLVTGGGCKMTRKSGYTNTIAEYEVDGYKDGELIVVIRHKYTYAYNGVDLSHPLVKSCNTDILNSLSDLETDGYIWDEPHFGFAFCSNNGRQISDNMYKLFEERFGYDLKNQLIHLWYDVEGSNSALVRLHYAEFMETALAEFELDFYTKGLKQLEEKGIKGTIGSHRTMHEETSDDFYIGCSDYFRHNEATTGGFTDSVFEREDSMIAMLQLANSLAMDNKCKDAFNMSWGFNPTSEQNDYYVSLLAAMNICWNGHAYHNSMMFGPGYPNHPIWSRMNEDLTEHKNVLELLEDAIRINDIAILYTWKSLAAFPDNYIHTHRRNLLFLSKTLTLNNKQHQFISYEILENAIIENREIKTRVGNFKKLVIPWCDFISKKAFEKLQECKEKGVSVIIFGPPANTFADGSTCANDFATLCSIEPMEDKNMTFAKTGETIQMADKQFELNPFAIQDNYDSNSDDTYVKEFKCYILDTKNATAKINGACVGVKSGSIEYFATEIPFFAGAIDFIFENSSSIKAIDNLILFEYKTDNGNALSGISRWNKPLTGEFIWHNTKVILEDCKLFVIRIDKDSKPMLYSTGKLQLK